MKKLITFLLIAFSLVAATDIHRPIYIIEESVQPSQIIKQDEIYAIDFGTIFQCQDEISNNNKQLSQEVIEQSLKECDMLHSISENKEQRNIAQGKMKVCFKKLFQDQQTKEYVALNQYVDCLVNDTVKKYNIDRIANNAESSSDGKKNQKKGYQQIQDECSSELLSFDNEKVIGFFEELDKNCLIQKKEVYIRMRVLEEASKEFDILLDCIDQIQSKNTEGKQLIREYITCQQESYVPNTKRISTQYFI
ncbi:hypothetical protein TTHERM_00194210 (macronuclear) [Tetrahymena thermophila SB210]|uniref:Transmembrane protein n=1 Tax=Tetrahymena thermophila (strain SB210) TaxID=312017 RepID=Q23KB4_TETTS|nr:hypothetical protein TTHERM_00194210 [Tetrahymena thermophila SB210]EAR96929.2 hypothetical protein TTHERM_00194210 [Tetrahymena thermophila SB210]|eukprot:XP_001017174.2 hypothetical protein TTHERM_00194210 [Tetrahymena thermophila SB210]